MVASSMTLPLAVATTVPLCIDVEAGVDAIVQITASAVNYHAGYPFIFAPFARMRPSRRYRGDRVVNDDHIAGPGRIDRLYA
jgi:hypothetical protein